MGYLHGTPNYDLPQTIGTDVRDWFDTNEAFAKVDKALGDVVTESANNVTRLDTAEENIQSHNTRITTLESEMDIAQSDIDTLEANVATLVHDVADQFQDVKDAIDPDEETTATASHLYKVGERFWYNDTWYRCTVQIEAGDTIVPNVNCTSINVDSELTRLGESGGNTEAEVEELSDNMGDLSELSTTDKSSVVNAVNELNTAIANAESLIASLNTALGSTNSNVSSNTSNIGTLSSLQTTNKSNLVSAINEVLGKVSENSMEVVLFGVQTGTQTIQLGQTIDVAHYAVIITVNGVSSGGSGSGTSHYGQGAYLSAKTTTSFTITAPDLAEYGGAPTYSYQVIKF